MTTTQHHSANEEDVLLLAIRRDGAQTTRIVHKSDAGLVQDCRWLDDPESPSKVSHFLCSVPVAQEALQPCGYGLIAVDFDRRAITSIQTFREVDSFSADEFGYPRFAGPTWMDWPSLLHHAFERGAVDAAHYTSEDGARSARIVLPETTRFRQTLALRFASKARPRGYALRRFTFQPPGWKVNQIKGASKLPSMAAERAFTSLTKAGWRCAPLAQWKQCPFG